LNLTLVAAVNICARSAIAERVSSSQMDEINSSHSGGDRISIMALRRTAPFSGIRPMREKELMAGKKDKAKITKRRHPAQTAFSLYVHPKGSPSSDTAF
jgi:hypothetical protein